MIDFILSAPIFLLAFVVVISIVVVIHELGHYWVGRWCGVTIESFSIGFGPTLLAWTDKHDTVWRVAALPLGGYVKFLGDADAASAPDAEALETLKAKVSRERGPDAVKGVFHFLPLWRRAAIVAAGPVANFLLAIAIFAGIIMTAGVATTPAIVGSVLEDSAAEEAGFLPNDEILAIDGRAVESFTDVAQVVALRAGDPLRFDVLRDGETITLNATPRRTQREDPIGGKMSTGVLGIGQNMELNRERHGPVTAIAMGAGQTWTVVATTGDYLGRIIRGKEPADMLGGPIRIATYSGKTAVDTLAIEADPLQKLQILVLRLISLAGVVSVGLGLINLVPIPVLDGGHLLYYAYEAVAGRPLSERAQAFGFKVGLLLVASLMLFATWNDLIYLRGFFS